MAKRLIAGVAIGLPAAIVMVLLGTLLLLTIFDGRSAREKAIDDAATSVREHASEYMATVSDYLQGAAEISMTALTAMLNSPDSDRIDATVFAIESDTNEHIDIRLAIVADATGSSWGAAGAAEVMLCVEVIGHTGAPGEVIMHDTSCNDAFGAVDDLGIPDAVVTLDMCEVRGSMRTEAPFEFEATAGDCDDTDGQAQ